MQLLQLNEAQQIPRETQIEWLPHVVQSAFAGRRVVIFYGGAKNDDENAIFEADRAIRDGGGFVSIIGRNVFQRETADALLLESMMNIYAEGGERQEIID